MSGRIANIRRLIAVLGAACALISCRQTAPGDGASPSSAPFAAATQAPATEPAQSPPRFLRFTRDDQGTKKFDQAGLLAIAPPISWTGFDPEYQKVKTFRTVPLKPVLTAAFAMTPADLAKQEFVLRALDGYTIPISGSLLMEDGAAIAFADAEFPGWEPVGPRKANPGPYYLIWTQPHQQDHHAWPRPYQLVSIEIARFEGLFPHTVPAGAPADSPAAAGFQLFRELCFRCHAINREGGRVGPELNVPKNILEYRPAEQVRAYIRNPLEFRYGAMPPHQQLGDGQLDALIAYLRHMKNHKHDRDAK
ncbi:MAG: hypothetical protein GMKNLPBB_02793 [Myxococcota bacterium]|nr:hypothetical protein [Myxococcota bacterium]